ncbi:hypothetical protein T492DRAFT_853251 [Pavlovales sp. CCMP2436]|nr:hypothetical protein T492DRAFT_853251 [Pavlovales sp. CCMP2436]
MPRLLVIGCVLIWAVATAWSVQQMSRLSAESFRAPAPPSSLAVTVSTKGSALVDSEALERFAQLYAKWSEFTAKLGCETADLGKVEGKIQRDRAGLALLPCVRANGCNRGECAATARGLASKNNWCLSPLFAHTLGRMYGKARVLDLGW